MAKAASSRPGTGDTDSGTISALDLKNVTIEEALDQVSALYGYSISRSGNIFQVTPGGMETRDETVADLAASPGDERDC